MNTELTIDPRQQTATQARVQIRELIKRMNDELKALNIERLTFISTPKNNDQMLADEAAEEIIE